MSVGAGVGGSGVSVGNGNVGLFVGEEVRAGWPDSVSVGIGAANGVELDLPQPPTSRLTSNRTVAGTNRFLFDDADMVASMNLHY